MRFTKTILSLCGLVFAATMMAMPVSGNSFNSIIGEDPEIVHIRVQTSNEPSGNPRTEVPFFAAYYESLSSVMLGCNDSIGDVTVTLESTAGDWYQTEFDTSDGAILVPASGLTGHYVLTIETADHTVYEGEFNL